MSQLLVAVFGGVIVLGVQGAIILLRQWRRRINEGAAEASRTYVRFRRLAHLIRKRSTIKKLQLASAAQLASIEAQYAQDPMWRLGQVRLVQDLKDSNDKKPHLTLAEALSNDNPSRGIFVKGESGSGKSSTSALTVVTWTRTPLALRIDLSSFNSQETIIEQAANEILTQKDLERGLALGLVTIIFDGFESLNDEASRAAYDSSLRALLRRYPDMPFAVLTRPENPPTRNLLNAAEYTLSVLSESDIEEAIRSINIEPRTILDQMDENMRALCTSPLALRMVLQAYADHGVVPTNHSILYRDFVSALVADRPRPNYAMATISGSVKLELLSELAWNCDNRTTSLDYPAAQRVIRPKMVEMVSKYLVPATVDQVEILRELVSDGILRSDNKLLRFVHYSVQEFLAAVAVNNRLGRNEVSLDDVVEFSTRREWRNSIVFLSGLMSDSTGLVERLRLKNTVLAAECIKTALYVDAAFVDKCIVEALYEFKFGKMSFNYDLVFALMLIADRCSPDIPARIITEMDYWCRKYATRPYSELDGIDDSSLLNLLKTGEVSPQVMNAVWTLGVRGVMASAPYFEHFLKDRIDPLDHVSALALGKLKSTRSAQLLLSTAFDRDAPDYLRSSCFNSVGMIGAKECLPSIAEFIRSKEDLEGTIRENAAWALIGLVDDYLVQDPGFQSLLIDQLSVGTRYARAMFAYLIGRFQIQAGLQRLIEFAADTSEDPLFLEDVVFAIGDFRNDEALDVITALFHHPDNIVRARAIEAAAKIPRFDKSNLLVFAGPEEGSEIVRDSAREQLGLPDPKIPPTEPPQMSADVRRRR